MRKNLDCNFYEDFEDEIENDCLTPREVMNYLCIGRNLFYRLVNSGELPAFRIGKLWRVSKEDLVNFSKVNETINL